MGIVSIPQPEYGMSITDLIDIVARQSKMLEFLVNGRIDSANVREIAGFNVSATTFKHKSGIVGMSSAGSLGSSVRFWAGNADPNFAPFRVTQDGSGFASNFTIEGGVIRTNPAGNQRIELSSGSFKGYTADNLLSGLVFDPNKSSDIVDLFLYHRGSKLVEFFDSITQFRIRGATGATGFTLGGNGVPTFGDGNWSFNAGFTVTFNGSLVTNSLNGILKGNGSGAVSAISGVSGTVYVSATSGGSPTTAITFTNGIRTS